MTTDCIGAETMAPMWVDDILHVLSATQTRRATRAVDRIAPCRFEELATHLDGCTEKSAKALRQELYHVRLPKLTSVGMIHYEDDAIDRRDHPGWDAGLTNTLLAYDSGHVDEMIRCVSNPTTRGILAILESRPQWCGLDEIEEHLPSPRVSVDLHHYWLPQLQAAGLLKYSPGTRMINYHGDPCISELLTAVADVAEEC